MARAIVYTEIGSPDVLHLIEIPDPVAGDGEVVVRDRGRGCESRSTRRSAAAKRPSPPITEPRPRRLRRRRCHHRARRQASRASRSATGSRSATRIGTYASAIASRRSSSSLLPDSVTAAEGAGIGIPAGTAYQALRSLGVERGRRAARARRVRLGRAGRRAVRRRLGRDRHRDREPRASRAAARTRRDPGRVRRRAAGARRARPLPTASRSRWTAPAPTRPSRSRSPSSPTATASRRSCADRMPRPSASAPSPADHPCRSPTQELAWRAEALAGDRRRCSPPATSRSSSVPQLPLAEAARAHELVESGAASGKIVLIP